MSDDTYMEWQPATIEVVKKIVQEDLAACDHEQVAAFESYAIEQYRAPILRYGKDESVVVVAQRGYEVIYWEDVEEGFNHSPIASDWNILEHWCNQHRLGDALNVWIEGRSQPGRFGRLLPSSNCRFNANVGPLEQLVNAARSGRLLSLRVRRFVSRDTGAEDAIRFATFATDAPGKRI